MTDTIAAGPDEAPPKPVKDRRPKMPGSARAAALLVRHCRITPFVHQADGLACMLERFERFGSFGLFHDMGCGKTLTMYGAFLTMADEGQADLMLVICPATVMQAWEREAEGILARGGIEIDVLPLNHSSVKRRIKALEEWLAARRLAKILGQEVQPGVVVVNYESTWRMEKQLRVSGFDLVVCDESQRIKAPGSNQSLTIHRIGQAHSSAAKDAWAAAKAVQRAFPRGLAPRRVLMTGTPIPEGGLDWYGQFRFLDPTVFGTNYANYKRLYATEIDCGTFKKVIINPYAAPELEAKVMERVHRVSKEEAVDLPEQTHVHHSFDLAPKQRRIYDELVRDSIAFVDGKPDMSSFADLSAIDMGDEVVGDNVLTRMLRLQQICGGYMQVDGKGTVEPCIVDSKGVITNPKLKVLRDLMQDLIDAGKKVVVFHRFTHEGLAIIKLAQELSGDRPVSHVSGAVKTRDRKQMVTDFQDGDAQVFVGQIQACAEGITLNAASDGVFYSLPFAAAVFQQALARYHRIGQTMPVTHHHLIANKTIDETIVASQMMKQNAQFEAVDGGWQRFLTGAA